MGFLRSSVGKESTCSAGDSNLIPGSRRSAGEGIRQPTPVFLGFPCGSAGKESACNVRYLVFNSWVGKIPWRREKYPLQYSGLENSMNCIVHGVTRSWTQLSDFHFTSDSLIISWCLQDWWCKKTLHKGRGDQPLLENLLSFWDFPIKYHCHHYIDYIGYCCSFDSAAQMRA